MFSFSSVGIGVKIRLRESAQRVCTNTLMLLFSSCITTTYRQRACACMLCVRMCVCVCACKRPTEKDAKEKKGDRAKYTAVLSHTEHFLYTKHIIAVSVSIVNCNEFNSTIVADRKRNLKRKQRQQQIQRRRPLYLFITSYRTVVRAMRLCLLFFCISPSRHLSAYQLCHAPRGKNRFARESYENQNTRNSEKMQSAVQHITNNTNTFRIIEKCSTNKYRQQQKPEYTQDMWNRRPGFQEKAAHY